jgi:hypothetical protein
VFLSYWKEDMFVVPDLSVAPPFKWWCEFDNPLKVKGDWELSTIIPNKEDVPIIERSF